MNNSIKQIFYDNIFLLKHADKALYYIRTQNFDKALRIMTIKLNCLNSYLPFLFQNQDYFNTNEMVIIQDNLLEMLTGFLDAQEKHDYVLLADLIEIQFIPYIMQLQGIIIQTEQNIFHDELYQNNLLELQKQYPELVKELLNTPDKETLQEAGYHIELTACGLKTLACFENTMKYYFHSNNQVYREGFELANSWYLTSEEAQEFIIYGYGLGYHIKELMDIDSNLKIEVYESDINVIQMACYYTELTSVVSNPNFKIFYDPDFSKLSSRIRNLNTKSDFVIHYPSLRNIKLPYMRKKLEEYFLQFSSIKNQQRLLKSNFNDNIQQYDSFVDVLKDEFKDKDLYIIAAGPSLDKNYMQLKALGKSGIIMATGTVLKKLIRAEIIPDYIIVTDANDRVYSQIAGLEHLQIPLLFLSTACKDFAKKYQGKKYIIFQKNYIRAEEYSKKYKCMLFQTGGSVATTALDIGISFECKRIIFLGLDLAYTDNYVHAAGTSLRELNYSDGSRQVEDINGMMINTSKSLDIYRQWIEKRIQGIKDIDIIDATEGGARIMGMKIMNLSGCINRKDIDNGN